MAMPSSGTGFRGVGEGEARVVDYPIVSHLNIHVDQKIIIARLNYYASADDTSLKNTPQQEPSYEY